MNYPITRLILSVLNTQNTAVAKRRLAKRLSLSRNSKAYRVAEEVIDNGTIKPYAIKELALALQLPVSEVESALKATTEERRTAKRADIFKEFGPHLYVKTTGPKSSFTVAALVYKQFLYIKLQAAIDNLPMTKQLELVHSSVKAHMTQHEGKLPLFGTITGYLYCPNTNSSYELNTEGELLSGNEGSCPIVEASVTVGGKPLTLS
ncbi:MAG: hypothetical protein CMP47_00390 [Rickettsiales bacterium]|nr:hypothetical protein [Rickettsiales bacterium]